MLGNLLATDDNDDEKKNYIYLWLKKENGTGILPNVWSQEEEILPFHFSTY